ncbi:MAG: hypothetical protein A2X31_10225 [Elusimicrobia bacterium GWB2_63_22]|nr:MAG: hypothetical protein A2X31_10225 [Elusimicrobia bacterium GWB2_63_22]
MKMPACLFSVFSFLFGVTAAWAIPAGFNVQGRLTDANGVNKDGTFSVKFSVFETNSGGSPKWEKSMTSVVVKNGNFQVVLAGADDSSNQLEEKVKDLGEAYVELKVGNDPPLVPRQMLLRSPFSAPAVVSGQNDVLIEAVTGRIAMRTGNAERVTVSNDGNVGVGSSNPDKKLVVAGDAAITGSISAGNLVGAVVYFAGPGCPSGWLLLDGSTLPASGIYKPLSDQIAYIYGGSGANFVLPNLSDGAFIRSTGGKALPLGKKQDDAFQGHRHGMETYQRTGAGFNLASGNFPEGKDTKYTNSTLTDGAYGPVKVDSETRPRNYAMLPCIKY